MPDQDGRWRPDLLPWIIVAALAALGFGLWHLFPVVQRAVLYQDCIASGRVTGC